MSIPVILGKVRDRISLSKEEYNEVSTGLVDGSVSDAQAAAFAMAVFLNGLNEEGRVALTLAMRDSGRIQSWDLPGPVVDKHSTGGIGDNVSLILAPMLVACGAYVPMVSGRGLGHTGGTLDKLEAIPGYRTQVAWDEFRKVVREVGCAIVGAGKDIAPADKRLYAIRDLTGTVESVDLITSSILSKKLAAGLEALVLDVKVGSGSFMQDIEDARKLARALVSVARGAGCPTTAILTDMNQSLSSAVGNGMEVASALKILRNEPGEERLLEVTLSLGTNLLVESGLATDRSAALELLNRALDSGKAAEVFGRMVFSLGGPHDFFERSKEYLPGASKVVEFTASRSGYLRCVNARMLGQVIIALGGGRTHAHDVLDLSVGLDQAIRIGDQVNRGEPILRIHASSEGDIERAQNLLIKTFEISENPIELKPVILETITPDL